MPPKKSLSTFDDSDDDDLLNLPDETSAKPKASPTMMTMGSPSGSGSAGGAAAGGSQNYASQLLANRRGLREQRQQQSSARSEGGMTPTGLPPTTPTAATEQQQQGSAPTSVARNIGGSLETPRGKSPGARQPSPKGKQQQSANNSPMHSHTAAAAAVTTSQQQQHSFGSPVTTTTTETAATPPPPPPPGKSEQQLLEERIATLKAQVDAKKAELQRLKDEETELKTSHDDKQKEEKAKLKAMDRDVERLWSEAENERTKVSNEIADYEVEQERIVKAEKERVQASVQREAEPHLNELKQKLAELREKKTKLAHGITLSGANKDLVSTAIASALSQLMERVQDHFQKNVAQDPDWEESVRRLIKKEVEHNFTQSLAAEEETERKEHAASFQEMLTFWRQAEDEERQQILKMDEQLLMDMQSMAGDDLDRMHREEMSLHQAYMESREAWAKHHRETLNGELDAAIRRRTVEFEDMRSQRQNLYGTRLQNIEEQHRQAMQKEKELHERELEGIRSTYAQRQLLNEERHKAVIDAREKAAESSRSLNGVVLSVGSLLDKLEEYRSNIERKREDVDKEHDKLLSQEETSLSEIQAMVTEQAQAVEAERRALASTAVKLEVVHSSLQKQLEDERTWVAQTQAKLERSRSDWEREYRRWQHVSAQEKQNVEERFSSVLLDLRGATSALDEEAKEIEVETNSLTKRSQERTTKTAIELNELRNKEAAINERYAAMMELLTELEGKGDQMSSEWGALHKERQDLVNQRQELYKEELKMQQLADQLQAMRGAVDKTQVDSKTAAEKAKLLQQQIALARSTIDADAGALDNNTEKIASQRERILREQTRLNEMLATRHQSYAHQIRAAHKQQSSGAGGGQQNVAPNPNAAAATGGQSPPNYSDRLPQRMMSELREVLRQPSVFTTGNQSQNQSIRSTQQQDQTGLNNTTINNRTAMSAPGNVTSHQTSTFRDPGASSFNFTNLVPLSENDSTTS